jgi:hypothetical protein
MPPPKKKVLRYSEQSQVNMSSASLCERDAKNQYLVRGNKIAFDHPVADEHIVVCLCNNGSNLHVKAIR